MRYRVEQATEWSQVDAIAKKLGKCIPTLAHNNPKAVQTWDTFYPDDCLYYLVSKEAVVADPLGAQDDWHPEVCGYARMLKVAPETWVLDYVCPTSFEIVINIAQQLLPATVLAKQYTAGDADMVKDCPHLSVGFARLDKFPYSIQRPVESVYVVVVPALVKEMG